MFACGNKTNQEPVAETIADTIEVAEAVATDSVTVAEPVETAPVAQECQTCGGTGEVNRTKDCKQH